MTNRPVPRDWSGRSNSRLPGTISNCLVPPGFGRPLAALMYRRSLVEKIGGFRLDLPVIQDARFFVRRGTARGAVRALAACRGALPGAAAEPVPPRPGPLLARRSAERDADRGDMAGARLPRRRSACGPGGHLQRRRTRPVSGARSGVPRCPRRAARVGAADRPAQSGCRIGVGCERSEGGRANGRVVDDVAPGAAAGRPRRCAGSAWDGPVSRMPAAPHLRGAAARWPASFRSLRFSMCRSPISRTRSAAPKSMSPR